MQSITTKYISATNTRGSRIKATAGKGQTITISFPYGEENEHRVAAIALIKKLDWCDGLVWVEGGTETGSVFCAFNAKTYTGNEYNVFAVSK